VIKNKKKIKASEAQQQMMDTNFAQSLYGDLLGNGKYTDGCLPPQSYL
jgi:hypothetical protein